MDPNTDSLAAALSHYQETLDFHNERLNTDFHTLMKVWETLRQDYNGKGSDELAHHWQHTAEWFESYYAEMRAMIQFLEARSNHLKQL